MIQYAIPLGYAWFDFSVRREFLMKNVLMISYYYPPLNDVAILRTVGFSNHLCHFGWQPIILTVKNPDLHFCSLDPNHTHRGQIVYRSGSIVNHFRFAGKLNAVISKVVKLVGIELDGLIPNLLLVPDFACGWIPLTVLKGLQLIRSHKIDAIYATCGPNSSAVIGTILSKLSGKPLIIDLRDPWRQGMVQKMVGNRLSAYVQVGDRLKDFMDKVLETKTLGQATKVILVTQETFQVYSRLYPFLKDRLEVIYNGYADDFFTEGPEERFQVFTIVYSGSYYYYLDQSESFFQALANIRQDSALNGNIRFLYIGRSSIISKLIKKYDLHQIADCAGYLGRKEAIGLMRKASVLLLRNIKPHLSTKLFEGLASGLPLLAMTGEGEAGDLIRQYSPSSIIVEGSNAKEIENVIRTMHAKWRKGELSYEVHSEFKNDFSKYKLTEKLASILDKCMDSNDSEERLNG